MFFEVGTERKYKERGAENDTGTWRQRQNITDIGMVADIERQSNDIKAVQFKGTVPRKLMKVNSGINWVDLLLTLNRGYFIFKFTGAPSFKFNKTCFSI
jgi:hypothetical protein